jgi:hypothetical protein
VLIKNAEALENMNKVNVLITDKTHNIGKPSVEKVFAIQIMKRTCNSLLPESIQRASFGASRYLIAETKNIDLLEAFEAMEKVLLEP